MSANTAPLQLNRFTTAAQAKASDLAGASGLSKGEVIGDYPVKISYGFEAYANTSTPIIYSLKDWGLNHLKKVTDRE